MRASARRRDSRSPDWYVVIPVKRLSRAKSRLAPHSHRQRQALAYQFVWHVLATARDAQGIAGICVVTNDPRVAVLARRLGASALLERGGRGMDAAVRNAVVLLSVRHGVVPCAVLTADLPGLEAEELTSALQAATSYSKAVVGDADGNGTVLLTSRSGAELVPRYGHGSLLRHRQGGHAPLAGAWPGLRRDVDVPRHLVDMTDWGGRYRQPTSVIIGLS